MSLHLKEQIKQHPDMSGIAAGGEAVQYAYIFLIITGVIFFFISSGYAIAKQAETRFHLWAILIMITDAIVTIHIE